MKRLVALAVAVAALMTGTALPAIGEPVPIIRPGLDSSLTLCQAVDRHRDYIDAQNAYDKAEDRKSKIKALNHLEDERKRWVKIPYSSKSIREARNNECPRKEKQQ